MGAHALGQHDPSYQQGELIFWIGTVVAVLAIVGITVYAIYAVVRHSSQRRND